MNSQKGIDANRMKIRFSPVSYFFSSGVRGGLFLLPFFLCVSKANTYKSLSSRYIFTLALNPNLSFQLQKKHRGGGMFELNPTAHLEEQEVEVED